MKSSSLFYWFGTITVVCGCIINKTRNGRSIDNNIAKRGWGLWVMIVQCAFVSLWVMDHVSGPDEYLFVMYHAIGAQLYLNHFCFL